MPLQRKRPEDKSQTWRPRKSVLLYFDEIDEILAIMARFGGEVSAETADVGGTITTSEDLTDVSGDRLTDCVLATSVQLASGAEREMTVHLGDAVGVTIAPSDDLELAGASTRIQAIMNGNQRLMGGLNLAAETDSPPATGSPAWPWLTFLCFVAVVVGAIVLGVSFTSGTPTHTSSSGAIVPIPHAKPQTNAGLRPYAIGALSFGVLVLLGFALFGRNLRPRGTIVKAYRKDAPTWWQRNGTAVMINVATSIVIGVALFFLGRAFH